MMGKKVGKVRGKSGQKWREKRKYWQVKRWANGRQIRIVKMMGKKAVKIGGKKWRDKMAGKMAGKNGGKKWREKMAGKNGGKKMARKDRKNVHHVSQNDLSVVRLLVHRNEDYFRRVHRISLRSGTDHRMRHSVLRRMKRMQVFVGVVDVEVAKTDLY
jgi:hypothetical protein